MGDEERGSGFGVNHSLSQRAGERGECAADHGAFGPFQHEGVVHDAGSRFDVVACIAGERTPGSTIEGEGNTDPGVDGDCAVTKVMDGALQSGRVLFGGRGVDDQVGPEIAFEVSLANATALARYLSVSAPGSRTTPSTAPKNSVVKHTSSLLE